MRTHVPVSIWYVRDVLVAKEKYNESKWIVYKRLLDSRWRLERKRKRKSVCVYVCVWYSENNSWKTYWDLAKDEGELKSRKGMNFEVITEGSSCWFIGNCNRFQWEEFHFICDRFLIEKRKTKTYDTDIVWALKESNRVLRCQSKNLWSTFL
jgi:hypothetical protein